ncbi:hypothetical protein KUL42_08700 [Alteromonas sp. KUL42]|uniref:prolyl hydroxylase family protein n=1 Tax=Alteromonas sp. KUL42 TaxID=2480797 RepID=UPI0010355C8F|nr:2OG-Fe(II) oxygenase [Alteromonas sp. KUL42]TAP37676.1 2OG-Fe(II) oxygenase [Alteromonas sp. KUL42]GEA06109.1 hypothetical protein KUL42_08700 [Alteromonas sp. KUL42]
MVNLQHLLTQADACFQSGRTDEAYSFLKDAGQQGHIYAALDFAYFTAKDNSDSAISYLNSLSNSDNSTVVYHKCLIHRFYRERAMSQTTIQQLVMLAQKGHAESSIVLLSWCVDDASLFSLLQSHLAFYSPNIHKQLFQPLTDTEAKDYVLDIELITKVIQRREQKVLAGVSKSISDDKDIKVLEDALSPFECNYMIARYHSLLEPSLVLNPIDGRPMQDTVRTSEVAVISSNVVDWICRDIDLKMSLLSGSKVNHGEPLNLLCYQNGQQYKPHFDAFSEEQLKQKSIQEEGGQRTHTIIAYLNTLHEGSTSFPKLKLEVVPEQGKLLTFTNVDNNNKLKQTSYHCGNPVVSGKKWILTKWVRSNQTEYGTLVHGG